MNIPCCHKIVCPGAETANLDYDAPIANLTSELPDTNPFIGINTGWNANDPPLGSNWTRTSCLGVCESLVSQQDADLCAARANYICLLNDGWGFPPGSGGNGGPDSGPPVIFPPPGDPPAVFSNQQVGCTTYCPDGIPFTYTVRAGLFVATSQAQADSMARSYACQLAARARICLGNLPRSVCKDAFFAQLLNPSGGFPPYNFTVSSGSLPPGVTLDQSGANAQVGGIATSAGNYTFSIRVTDSQGNFMTKSYTMTVMSVTPTTLPPGQHNVAYSAQMTATGGTAPYTFSIAGPPATLPPEGLTFNSAGTWGGAPTQVGTFNFVVIVTDSTGLSCQTPCTMNVGGVCNTELHGFASCPGDPSKIANANIPANTYCDNIGTDQRRMQAFATQALNAQLAAALASLGCVCRVTVTGTPGPGNSAFASAAGASQVLHFTCPTFVQFRDINNNALAAPLNGILSLGPGDVNFQNDLFCPNYGCPNYPVGVVRVTFPFITLPEIWLYY